MDAKLKHLMKELSEAINHSLAESEAIAQVISRIKASGYDVFLVLEATVGVNRTDDKPARRALVTAPGSEPHFAFTPQDVSFLRSLRIRAEDT